MEYTKESCNIAMLQTPHVSTDKGQTQTWRAGCRIFDFPTETASNSVRANSGSFMHISTTINTQLRSAGHLMPLLM